MSLIIHWGMQATQLSRYPFLNLNISAYIKLQYIVYRYLLSVTTFIYV